MQSELGGSSPNSPSSPISPVSPTPGGSGEYPSPKKVERDALKLDLKSIYKQTEALQADKAAAESRFVFELLRRHFKPPFFYFSFLDVIYIYIISS